MFLFATSDSSIHTANTERQPETEKKTKTKQKIEEHWEIQRIRLGIFFKMHTYFLKYPAKIREKHI